jgi:ribonucleoside-triphosphate reductase (formate)
MSPTKTKRQPCEVYTRVTGYLRPVQQFNDGKLAEYEHRTMFKVGECR